MPEGVKMNLLADALKRDERVARPLPFQFLSTYTLCVSWLSKRCICKISGRFMLVVSSYMHVSSQKGVSAIYKQRLSVLSLNFQECLKIG